MSKQKYVIVETVADLATVRVGHGDLVNIEGYYTAGDKGGQEVRYDVTSTATVDGGWVFNGPGGVGRFIAIDQTVANVRKFGATSTDNGSGVGTDDQPFFQAAIDACILTGGGSDSATQGATTVYIPAGSYVLASPLVINLRGDSTQTRLTFKGDGWRNTVLRAASGATSATMEYFFDFTANVGNGEGNRFWTIRDLAMFAPFGGTVSGIDALKCAYWTVRDVVMYSCQTGIRMRNWSTLCDRIRFEFGDQNILVPSTFGITTGGGAEQSNNDFVFTNCSFASADYGYYQEEGTDVNNVKFFHNQFDGATRAAVVVNSVIDLCSFKDNYLEAQGAGGQATIFTNAARTTTANVDGQFISHGVGDGIIVSAQGSFHDNVFINGNSVCCFNASGQRVADYKGNRVLGASVAAFLRAEDASNIPSGPYPYTVTRNISVDQDRYGTGDDIPLIGKVVDFVDADRNGHCGFVINVHAKRADAYRMPRPFAYPDLSSSPWHRSSTFPMPIKAYEAGQVVFRWPSGGNQMRTIIDENRGMDSPFSNNYLTIYGDISSSQSGGATVSCTLLQTGTVTGADNAVFTPLSTLNTGATWTDPDRIGRSRQQVIYLNEVSGHGATDNTFSILLNDSAANAATGGIVTLRNFCLCSANYGPNNYPVLKEFTPSVLYDEIAGGPATFAVTTVGTFTDSVYTLKSKFVISPRVGQDVALKRSAGIEIIGTFVNRGGTITQQGSTLVVYEQEGASGYSADFLISGTTIQCRATVGFGANVKCWTTVYADLIEI